MKFAKLSDVKACYKPRSAYSHKGENGRVLIVGGSKDLVGAPALAAAAALAALRAGVDLVVVAAPEKPGWVINQYSPDIIVKKFRGEVFSARHVKEISSLAKGFDAVLIGPGLGRKKKTLAFAKALVNKIEKIKIKGGKIPLVLDADAIKACAGMRFSCPAVITPHAREFEVFSGVKVPRRRNAPEVAKTVKAAAKKHNCTILLKGHTDVISDGRDVKLNRTGNAGMTVGGTGDVLAGICAALLALRNQPFSAACAAAYINGKAGDMLLKSKGYGFVAGDLPGEIPKIIKNFR